MKIDEEFGRIEAFGYELIEMLEKKKNFKTFSWLPWDRIEDITRGPNFKPENQYSIMENVPENR